jgi:hypothetical protein
LKSNTVQAYRERFGDISAPGNGGDLSTLFVSQTATNFKGHTLEFKYEPIPDSVSILTPHELIPCLAMENLGYFEGSTFVFTNDNDHDLSNDFVNGSAQIHYFKKRLR